MTSLTTDEIRLLRSVNLSNRADFMRLADEVCTFLDVPFAKICGITRGNAEICKARDMLCRIAHDRGFHAAEIARYIRRHRSSVLYSVGKTKDKPSVVQ